MFKKFGNVVSSAASSAASAASSVSDVATSAGKTVSGGVSSAASSVSDSVSTAGSSVSSGVSSVAHSVGEAASAARESLAKALDLPDSILPQICLFDEPPPIPELESPQVEELLKRFLKKLKKRKFHSDKSDEHIIAEWINDTSGDLKDPTVSEEQDKGNKIWTFSGFQRRVAQFRYKHIDLLDDSKHYPTSIKSKLYFGIESGEKFSHLKKKHHNHDITRIHKISVSLNEIFLESLQIDYVLSDGSIWKSPAIGHSQHPPQEFVLEENETITSLEGRAADKIYCLTFQIQKVHPDGSVTQRVFHPEGGLGGQKFSYSSSLPIIGFFGSSDKHHINSIGCNFIKEWKDHRGKVNTAHTWDEAIHKKLISWYFLPYFGLPGFSVPAVLHAETNVVDLIINAFDDLLALDPDSKNKKGILEKARKLKLIPSSGTLLEYNTENGAVSFQTNFGAPLYPVGKNTFDLPHGEKYKLLLSGFDYIATLPMDIIMEVLGKIVGWDVTKLKIVFANQSMHRAYEKAKGDPNIFVSESERNPNQDIIRRDIHDNAILYKIFENKYEEVMHLAKTEWHDKVDIYTQSKGSLTDEQKLEYKNYFIKCKNEVHDTLELIDFKYTLYHHRWQELRSMPDWQQNSKHEIPHVENLSDEDITNLLLGRAIKEEEEFKKLLNKICKRFNALTSTSSLCKKLGVNPRYYPLNMTRKLDVVEMVNRKKVEVRFGPLKTKDRGLVKVQETKDKTEALLDTLRATILCKDPVVPLMVVEHLRNTGKLTRVKNKTAPTEPFKCVHINLCLGTSPRTIYELQIMFEEYFDLQKKDHDYYEIVRTFK